MEGKGRYLEGVHKQWSFFRFQNSSGIWIAGKLCQESSKLSLLLYINKK